MRGALAASTFLCTVAAVLTLLVLLAGINKNILTNWYFLRTTTAGLDVKSALQSSSFLQDLSSLTGVDLVGKEQTAESLGIAPIYTVSLFSACAKSGPSGDAATTCTASAFGFSFNPVESLKLDQTGLEGILPADFLASITYGTASRAIAILFILATGCSIGTVIMNILSCCAPGFVFGSMLNSIFATIFQLAASSAAIAVFTKLKNQYNSELSESGIKTWLGYNLFAASWIAFGLLFVNTILIIFIWRRNRTTKRRGVGRGRTLLDHTGLDQKGGEAPKGFGPPKRTRTIQLIKNHLPGFGGKHKYAQIDRQSGVKSITVTDHDADRDVLVKKGFGGGEDEHDDEREELVRGSTRGISMQPLGGKPAGAKVVETGYEPFRHA